jgi:hypothetical protein
MPYVHNTVPTREAFFLLKYPRGFCKDKSRILNTAVFVYFWASSVGPIKVVNYCSTGGYGRRQASSQSPGRRHVKTHWPSMSQRGPRSATNAGATPVQQLHGPSPVPTSNPLTSGPTATLAPHVNEAVASPASPSSSPAGRSNPFPPVILFPPPRLLTSLIVALTHAPTPPPQHPFPRARRCRSSPAPSLPPHGSKRAAAAPRAL